MIVELTAKQTIELGRFITGRDTPVAELWADWWRPEQRSRNRFTVMMPAIGWNLLAADLFEACFTARGSRRRDVPLALPRALRAVQVAVNLRSVHPALSGVAAAGRHGEYIPAWRLLGPDRLGRVFSAFPVDGVEYRVLQPVPYDDVPMPATRWVPGVPLASDPLILEEASHLAFHAASAPPP